MGRNRKESNQLSVTLSVSLLADDIARLKRLMADRSEGRSAVMQAALRLLYAQSYPNETNSNPTK